MSAQGCVHGVSVPDDGREGERGVVIPFPPTAPPPTAIPNLAAICRTQAGRYRRIHTYCEPLDRLTRGGLQTKRLVFVGGAPGANKSTWTLSMALDMARYGVRTTQGYRPVMVAFMACDEPRDGMLSRLGQMFGCNRDDLENEDTQVSGPAWEYVARQLDAVPNLLVFDPREDAVAQTVESVAYQAHVRAASLGARFVLVVDSVQRARFQIDVVGEEGTPGGLAARVEALRKLCTDLDCCVICTTELNRPAYSQGAKPDMTGFKGSGSIEYQGDLALMLQRVEANDYDVTPVKNRISSGAESLEPFRLRRDVPRCRFVPVPREDAGPDPRAEAERMQRVEDQLLDVLRSEAVYTKTAWADLVRGVRKETKMAVINALLASARVCGGGDRPFMPAFTRT